MAGQWIAPKAARASVATPASGKVVLFTDSANGHLTIKDESGTFTDIQAASSYSDLDAQDALGAIIADSGSIDFTYVSGVSLTGIVKDDSITAAKIAATTADSAMVTNGSGKPSASSVTATELGYLSGVTSAVQTQLDAKQDSDVDLDAIVGLSATGILTRTGSGAYTIRSIGVTSDLSVSNADGVSGDPTIGLSNSGVTAATYGDTNKVAIINVDAKGRITGASNHTLVKADVGLGSVDNTADADKPVSTDQAAADAAVQAYAIQRANHTGSQSAATITGLAAVATSGAKADVGLGNVDNTSDANKPVSTAQATAIGLKASKAGDTFTGPVVIEGDNAGTGYTNLKSQTNDPSTPASGVALFADETERFSFKGQSGYVVTFDDQTNTGDHVYTLPDDDVALMPDPMTTVGDLIYRNSSNATDRLPIGAEDYLLRSVGGELVWQEENLTQDFGDASDGNLTVSGSMTLTQIMYYDTLTIEAGAAINTGGYPIYARVLDLTNAPAGAIHRNGNNGTSVAANTGGAGGAALAAGVLGASGAGSAGAAGASNAGTASAAPTNVSVSNGGSGGASGASGAGGTGALAASGAGASALAYTHLGRFEYQFIRGASQIGGGAGGDGGNSGGGDGANTSRGGGGGGGGAGVVAIYAGEIITSVSTPSGVIQAKGGNGGTTTTAPASGNVGGAGGAGGGGGGFVYVSYVKKTGPVVSGLIECSGGTGGNGGAALGTGIGGNGGTGGNGGVIQLYNVTTGAGAATIGSTGSAGTAGSGTTGGTGGNGGNCVASL